jgi:hypothetical protein
MLCSTYQKKRRKLSQVRRKKSRHDIKKCRVSKDILWQTIYLVNTSMYYILHRRNVNFPVHFAVYEQLEE